MEPAGPAGAAGPQGPKGDTGAPGTGATMTAPSPGDANCPDGGTAITDGNGNVAYACNGTAGAADLQPFSAGSTDAFSLPGDQGYVLVPGLSAQVTPATASTYLVAVPDVLSAGRIREFSARS